MRLAEVEKLSHDQVGIAAAYRAGVILHDRGWVRYPAHSWDKPAILAYEGDRCVGGINFAEDDDDLTMRVHFAWCDPDFPAALVAMLALFRRRIRASRCRDVQFTFHEGNEPMAKAARA